MKAAPVLKWMALGMVCAMTVALAAGCGGNTEAPVSGGSGRSTTAANNIVDIPDYVPDGESTDATGGTAEPGATRSPDGTKSGKVTNSKTQSGTVKTTTKSVNAPTTPKTTAGDKTTDPFANIPKALRGTTVTVAHWGDEGASEYVKVAKQFTKDTSINVRWVPYSETDYVSSVVNQIAAKAGPDVVILNGTFPAAMEMVQPLPAIFNVNDGFWDKRVSEALSVKGKKYFVNSYNSPFTGGTVVYYNKKIFNDNGLTNPQDYYNQGKWTYENMEKCMQQVKKVGYHGGVIESIVIAEQMGSSLIQYDKATGTFKGNAKDNNLVSALQYMARGVEEGITGGYTISNFASGQVGLCMAGTYGLKYNGYFKDMSPSEIGVLPLPTSYEGKALKYLPVGLRGYGIAKGAKNVDGSYYFLRYFLDYSRYEKAGASIFSNKVMEKYFVETQLPLFKKASIYFEYYNAPLNMVGKSWGSSDWTAVRHAAVGQIAVELDKMANVCDNAASVANEKLKSIQ